MTLKHCACIAMHNFTNRGDTMNTEKSTFLDGFKSNYNTIVKAAKAGDLALLETQDAVTGQKVAALVAVNFDGKDFEFVPLARMIEGNPYEQLNPPDPTGSFVGDGSLNS